MAKKLSQFLVFDSDKFLSGKRFLLTKIEMWKDGSGNDAKVLGTKITGACFVDNTQYREGQTHVNRGETFTVKTSQPVGEFSGWTPFRTGFVVSKVTKASVWGDFRNHLSITGEVSRLQQKQGGANNNAAK